MYNISPNIKLELSRDGMKAYVTLLDEKELDSLKDIEGNAHGSESIEVNKIVKEIKNIIKLGLKEDKLRQILTDRDYNRKICIANGIKPLDGKDGYVKYFFDEKRKLTPKILKDGTVDYRELDSINNVNKGEQLAQIVPPKEGEYGYKVTGERIPYRKGKKPVLRFGKNVTLLDDGVSVVAEESGLVRLSNGKIVVSEVFEVSNVDKKVGNIYFNGTVIVNENILNGYRIEADGDVEVKGLVEGGYIQNAGDVLVKRGIQGYNRLAVKSQGNIITKFIENARIESAKNVTAEAIMHSYVVSEKNIVVIGRRGLIAGGVCRAGREIRAKTIGSSMATTTIVEIGIEPELQRKMDRLKEEMATIEDNLKKIAKSMDLLETLKKAHMLDDKKSKMYARLKSTKDNLDKKLKVLKKQKEHIDEKIRKLGTGRIKVAGTVHPGVKIIIGNSTYYVKDEMTRCTFYRDEGDIRVGPY